LLQQLNRWLTDHSATDEALVRRFAHTRDEAAFAALLARHGPMVLGVCGRLLGSRDEVEDAFQATFLVFARRAGAIVKGQSVGPWLHGVAARVARRMRQTSRRAVVAARH
jgi:DNA-directed RNA polymerase specialized sigma24 family protein